MPLSCVYTKRTRKGHILAYYNGKRNKDKTRKSRLILGWAKKLKAIELLGGCCQSCQENKPWLLEFHHTNESEKEHEISFLKSFSWEKISVELSKCQLLCRNCHGDIHFKNNFLQLEQQIREKVVENNFCNSIDHSLVLKLNKEGLSQSKIAKQLNCGISSVCEILKSNNIHTFEKKKTIDPIDVIRLRESGLTNVEIGKELGIHRFTVPHIIKRWKEKNGNHSINT